MKLFIAQTIDGFIAGNDDSLAHLEAFEGNDYGYDAHIAATSTVVLGRRTFDRIFPLHGWTYPAHVAGIVMTRRALPAGAPPQVRADDDPARVAAAYPDAFIDGGAETIARFLAIGAVRRATIFTLPVRIGAGVRLFADGAPAMQRWTLQDVRTHPCGTIAATWEAPQTR